MTTDTFTYNSDTVECEVCGITGCYPPEDH